jgi:pimeloyl-ACP methyl ester carboxylesterase
MKARPKKTHALLLATLLLATLLSHALLLTTAAGARQAEGTRAPAPTGRLFDVGGYRLHLDCAGRGGPAVVLIAGSGDFSFDWSLVQPRASKLSRVCSYDRAGAAWSDLGPTPRTMRQEARELQALLAAAGVGPPYVLVGHSVGGLVARVYAERYPREVAGLVLVDSTTEDTTLSYQGKVVRVRDSAKPRAVPEVQTLATSPPRPPTQEDIDQAAFNLQTFGPPKIEPPYNLLPRYAQTLRLWALSNPKLSAATDDYWPEELQALHDARRARPQALGRTPLVVIVGMRPEPAPQGVSPEEWSKLAAEKRLQKSALTDLSLSSTLIRAPRAGHHIQLEQPSLVVEAIRRVLTSARRIRPSHTRTRPHALRP